MKDVGFGFTMTVMGMGITFLTLLLLVYLIRLLAKIFPYKKEQESPKETK